MDGVQRLDLRGKRHSVVRPVQKQKVDIIGFQLAEAFIDGSEKRLSRVVLDPDLGRQEQIAAGDAGSRNRFADLRFVTVDLGGIDMAKAKRERLRHDGQDIGCRACGKCRSRWQEWRRRLL